MSPFFFALHSGSQGNIVRVVPGRLNLRFFESTIAIIATQILGLVSVFFLNLLIARHFGEAGKGYISLLIYLAEVLYAFSNLALGFTGQYFIGKRLAPPRQLFSNVFVFSLGAGLLVVSLFAITLSFWSGYLQNLTITELLPSLLIALLLLVYEPCSQMLIALGKIGKRSAVVLSQNYLVLFSFMALVWATACQVQQAAWLYVAAYGVGALLAVIFLTREVGVPNQPSVEVFKSSMKYGGWIFAANFIGLLYSRVDFFMLSALGSIEAAGVYSVAIGLTAPLLMVSLGVNTVFYPKTSSETDAAAAVTTPFYYRQVLLVQLVGAAFLAVFARPVLSWYGAGFVEGFVPMLILLLATIGRGLNGILTLHILGRGKSFTKSLAMFSALCVAVLLNYLLIPRYGMVGAAVASTIAVVTENLILTYLYQKLVHGSAADLYRFEKRDFTATIREALKLVRRLIAK